MIINNENIEQNNIIISKDTEGMEKLLKKLNNELGTKKQTFILPECNLDLDFGEDFMAPSDLKTNNNNGNNLTMNLNKINNNNDFEKKNDNNQKLNNSNITDDISMYQINLNDNPNVKSLKENEIINSFKENNPYIQINMQYKENDNNNNNNIKSSSNNNNSNIKRGNNLLISSLNNNNEDNYDENEEIELNVKEIVDIQKQEIDKKRIELEEEEKRRRKEEQIENINKELERK